MSDKDGVVVVVLSNLFRSRSPPRLSIDSNRRTRKRRKRGEIDETNRVEGDLCLREEVSLKRLAWLSTHLELIVEEERTKFSAYADRMMETGARLVLYSPVAHGKGRLYADGALSLQGFSKGIRETLAYGIYHDIDMENCHPVFLAGICKKNGWLCPQLEFYISNREDVLSAIIKETNCERKAAKILMLSLMYGGKVHSWMTRHRIESSTMPMFVVSYAEELGDIASKVNEAYPAIPVPSPKNPLFSKMSLLIQDTENQVLLEMASFLKSRGFRPGVYMYDGLMVYRKKRGSTSPIDPQVLRDCEAHILSEKGWNIRLEEKPIGKGFEVPMDERKSKEGTSQLMEIE